MATTRYHWKDLPTPSGSTTLGFTYADVNDSEGDNSAGQLSALDRMKRTFALTARLDPRRTSSWRDTLVAPTGSILL